MLSKTKMPDAPVDHFQSMAFQVHDHFRHGVIGNVNPNGSVRCQNAETGVDPGIGEREILFPGHTIFPLIIRNIPIKGRVCKDQVDAFTRNVFQDVSAISDVYLCRRVFELECWLRHMFGSFHEDFANTRFRCDGM